MVSSVSENAAKLQVIGAGFGRTGTSSLKSALEEIGYGPCYHMSTVNSNPEHVFTWQSASRGKSVDWRSLFAGYRSTMDWPGCRYWRELVDQFPEAKVILTIRDFDSWYKSARTTIYNYDKRLEQKHRRFPWLRILRPQDFAWNQLAEILWGELGNFKGQFEDKEKARNIFQKHIEEVKAYVPQDRLLVYKVSDGWGPLCAFLGVPVPSSTFPYENKSQGDDDWPVIEKVDLALIALPFATLAALVAMLLHNCTK
jgi:hypothetical protein